MFDTMTLTKATGAVCGSLLVFLLGGWAAESIYSMEGGHGEGHAQGYVIDTGEEEVAEPVDEGPDLPALFAAAEASKGERVFNQCKACHMVEDGQNGVGPHLYGVVGRDVQAVSDYNYSGALAEANDVWSAEELYAFLENPQGYASGTSMGYSGLSKPEDRANLIAYLDQTDGTDDIEITAAAAEAPAGETATDDAANDEGAPEDTANKTPDEDMQDTTEVAAVDDAADEETTADQTDTAEAAGAGAGAATGFAAKVASADVDAGKKVFRQCSACHAVEPGRNMVGPSMHGVVGRDIASAGGFGYSDALDGLDGAWTPDELSAWLKNPREYAAGNRMGYPGLKDEQDRANVIAYLDSLDD